jgi:hypothetical protein
LDELAALIVRFVVHLTKLLDMVGRLCRGNGEAVFRLLYAKSSYRVEAMHQFRADEYLAKPINFERLRTVLEHLSTAA